MSFENQAGLVTGAASGIGRATACLLAEKGAYVAVADLDEEGGERTVELIRGKGGRADFHNCDITVSEQVEALVAAVVAAHGKLDFAHNNAGVVYGGQSIDEVPEEQFDRVVAVNIKGLWLCLKHEIRVMRGQGSGAIVNTSSISGLAATPMISPYNATKHAVIGLTKEAAVELGGTGIRVNCICPGFIETPMTKGAMDDDSWKRLVSATPLHRRGGRPEEIAAAVAWLLSSDASYVTGDVMVLDGGVMAQVVPAP